MKGVRGGPKRERGVHLSAAGAGPGAMGENAARIENRIRQDEEAAAERKHEEREQDLSEGGEISMS